MERSLWRRGWDPGGIGGASESGKKGKDVKIIHKVNSSGFAVMLVEEGEGGD